MQTTIITSKKTWKTFLNELWEYKDLFFLLGLRNILIQYKQTLLGVAWVIIRPLLTVVIFTVIFNRIAGINSDGVPYPLVVFSGMLVWQFFSDMLIYGSNCFINNQELITKVYFPRLLLPASRIFCNLVDFSIAFIFYLVISLLRYRVLPSFQLLLFPLFMTWLVVFSFSVSLFFASLIVQYRDFSYVIPFVTQLGIYVTPIGFDIKNAPHYLQYILALNPLTGIVGCFRWALLGQQIDTFIIGISVIMTMILCCISLLYFKKVESIFSDVI